MFENAAREDFLESGHLGRMQHTTLRAHSGLAAVQRVVFTDTLSPV